MSSSGRLRLCGSDVFPHMVDVVPESDHGTARIVHVTVSDQAAKWHNLRVDINRHRMETTDYLQPGDYAQLFVGFDLVMSDTFMERVTNLDLMAHAHGRVLIGGLGMGMIIHGLVKLVHGDNYPVTDITVVEASEDVIRLIKPTLPRDPGVPFKVVHNDIFHYKPERGERFNTVFLDIWPTLSADLTTEIATLKRRFGRYLDRDDPHRWMAAWREATVRRMNRARY